MTLLASRGRVCWTVLSAGPSALLEGDETDKLGLCWHRHFGMWRVGEPCIHSIYWLLKEAHRKNSNGRFVTCGLS